MSLRHMVVNLIAERGCGTEEHLAPLLAPHGFSRQQIRSALRNAAANGYLWNERPRRGALAVYWPGKKAADPMWSQLVQKRERRAGEMVSCVWELGRPKPQSAWPKPPPMRMVYRPLGDWNAA